MSASEAARPACGISVVIPAHDAEPFLGATIRSALDQTRPPMEILVVDDASRDSTARIASDFGDPVRLIPGGGRGVSAARNVGVAAARGSLVAFLDHDDLWEPTKLERQARLIEEDPGAVMVFTQARVEEAGAPATDAGEVFPLLDHPARVLADAHLELLHCNFVPMSSVLVRASTLAVEPGPFDPRYHLSEDWDLWLRLARRHPRGLRFIDEPLTRYRIVPGRATSRMGDLRLEDLEIFEREAAVFPELRRKDPERFVATSHRMRREAGYWQIGRAHV